MPNKLRLNIDLAKLQGALWFTSPKTGEKCLVIVPSRSRFKAYASKKPDKADSLYANLEVVPLKNGPNDREDTHFVVEPTTKDERESRDPPQLPILGSAREYDFGPLRPKAPQEQMPASSMDEVDECDF